MSERKTMEVTFSELARDEEKPPLSPTTKEIAVSSRSYDVFKTVFSHPTKENTGKVSQSEFQFMMREVGFGGQSMGARYGILLLDPNCNPLFGMESSATLSFHGLKFPSV